MPRSLRTRLPSATRRPAGLDVAQAFDDHVWDVYGFFAYRLNDRADAEDLTQQTFERALKAARRYDPERAKPRTWLLSIAHNLLIDHFRSDRRSQHHPLEADEDPDRHLPATAGPEEHGVGLDPELEQALGELSARDREIVALRYGGDLTGPEIAELLDLSLSNVQQILSRSLRRMRTKLDSIEP